MLEHVIQSDIKHAHDIEQIGFEAICTEHTIWSTNPHKIICNKHFFLRETLVQEAYENLGKP